MKRILAYIIFLAYANTLSAQVCPGAAGELQWNIWTEVGGSSETVLYKDEFYPTQPDVSITIYNLQTSYNYDDDYGSRLEGFIHVPSSGNVTFNITADRRAWFYLSSSDNPLDTALTAFTEDWTNQEEYDKYPSQTSSSIYLEAGVDYYFVIEHLSSNWQDFVNISWQTDFLPADEWHIVSGKYLKGIACAPVECLDRGQSCDDGNPSTTEDQLDGNCNCVGKPVTSNSCIGQRGFIQAYEYRNITGGSLTNLYNAPNYPAAPDYAYTPSYITRPYSSEENIGTLIQGYLTVPITGNYQFNISGDDNSIFYLSSDDQESNKEDNVISVPWWTNLHQQDKYPEQTSELIYLEKDKYYYFEANHKQGSGGNHLNVYWKTPQHKHQFKEISAFYMYDYACELACIPENTPCDDGNPFTNNDHYNADCDCVGTPCTGPDCDDLIASYVPYDKCGLTDALDNREDNNWLSCETSANPNTLRSNSHWLMLDLGERYNVLTSQVWNYNVTGATQNGMENVAVDYSEDGVNWTELGIYNWPLASGSGQYGGFSGPDFDGIYAQYILITSLNSTASCQGLGKIAFDAVLCPLAGTPCDDKNGFTINDAYDNNCNCQGEDIEENNCTEDNIMVSSEVELSTKFSANNSVVSTSTMLAPSVGMVAENFVELLPGFETTAGEHFVASIAECTSGMILPQLVEVDTFTSDKTRKKFDMRIINEASSEYILVDYFLPTGGHASLALEDAATSYLIDDMDYMNKGYYQKKIARHKLIGNNIKVHLQWEGKMLSKVLEF